MSKKKGTVTVMVPKTVWEAHKVSEGVDDPVRAVRDGESKREETQDRESPPNFDGAVVGEDE